MNDKKTFIVEKPLIAPDLKGKTKISVVLFGVFILGVIAGFALGVLWTSH
jgi:hypothetical protein